MFSVIYFVYRCDSLIESLAMCVRALHTEHNKQYRTRHQTEHIRNTKQNKAELPNTILSLLLKYSLILPNAKEKRNNKKKNISNKY